MPTHPDPRRERYCQERVAGKNQCDAFLAAGFVGNSSSSLTGNSSAMSAEPAIIARIAELLERTAKKAELKRADIIEMIKNDRDLARTLGQPSAAIRGAELLGKEIGMFVDRKEIKTGTLDDLDVDQLDELREAAIAEAARRIAGGNGKSEELQEDRPVLSADRPATPGALPKTS